MCCGSVWQKGLSLTKNSARIVNFKYKTLLKLKQTNQISSTKQVSIIKDMCYANLFKTDMRKNQRKIATSTFDFKYKSFSFSTRIADEQAIQDPVSICNFQNLSRVKLIGQNNFQALMLYIFWDRWKCDIRFCLKDTECAKIAKNIQCDSNSPYQWVNRPEK